MSKDLFLTTNNIDKNIEILDKKMSAISLKMEDERKLNDKLMLLLKNLQNTKDGSSILIDDSKEAYNIQYYYNVEIIIGILIVSVILAKLFRPASISVKK
jgi:hypothetical protein